MSPWAVLSVFGLLGVFAALSWALRRHALGRVAPTGVNVVAFRRLDFNASVWVVEVEGRRLVLGTGREGTRLLADLGGPQP